MNKAAFKANLGAHVKIRPLVYYADIDKYLDEDWIINKIEPNYFCVNNIINQYIVNIGYDCIREWADDFDKLDNFKRGKLVLKAQIILRGINSFVEPLTDSAITAALLRTADKR